MGGFARPQQPLGPLSSPPYFHQNRLPSWRQPHTNPSHRHTPQRQVRTRCTRSHRGVGKGRSSSRASRRPILESRSRRTSWMQLPHRTPRSGGEGWQPWEVPHRAELVLGGRSWLLSQRRAGSYRDGVGYGSNHRGHRKSCSSPSPTSFSSPPRRMHLRRRPIFTALHRRQCHREAKHLRLFSLSVLAS